MVAQRLQLVLTESGEPAHAAAGLRQVATEDTGHVLRCLAETLQGGTGPACGWQQAQDRRAGEPAVPTGSGERFDVPSSAPPTKRGRGHTDQGASILDRQPLLDRSDVWCPRQGHGV